MSEIRRIDFKKIEKLRLDKGLNMKRFCRQAKVAHATYKRVPDATKVKDDVIIRIAAFLKVKPSELVYWNNEPKAEPEGPGKSKKVCLLEKARTG